MKPSIKSTLKGTSAVALCLAATLAVASSHREAPGITKQPKIDATDFYMFRSYEKGRQDYVTLIANYQPVQAPYGGPNYFTMDPDAIYEIHVDNDADAIEDITFQFQFDNKLAGDTGVKLKVGDKDVAIPLRAAGGITASDPTGALNERESYTLKVIHGDRRSGEVTQVKNPRGGTDFVKPVDNIGNKTLPDYDKYAKKYIYRSVNLSGCSDKIGVFAGQRAEGFAVNLGEVFDLVNLTPIQGPSNAMWPQYDDPNFNPDGIQQDRANDDLIGKSNVTTIALEVPIACLKDDDPVIGAWTTASLPQGELEDPSPTYGETSVYGGAYVQQSRLSNPLVNELVIGLPDKDLFNAAEPKDDAALATYVTNPTLPALLNVLFNGNGEFGTDNIAPSNIPRNDLVTAFLTGFPGLNQDADFDAKHASEMLRLNTAVAPTAAADQNTFGVVGNDIAGFPNGRRPGDDTVDIALRVMMGRLCYDVPVGDETGAAQDNVNLGLCKPADAPAGMVPFTDGAPLNAARDFAASFPYFKTPLPGSSD